MTTPSSPEKERAPREKRGAQLVTITQRSYQQHRKKQRGKRASLDELKLRLLRVKQAAWRESAKTRQAEGGNHHHQQKSRLTER
jgi:hypothetical protein